MRVWNAWEIYSETDVTSIISSFPLGPAVSLHPNPATVNATETLVLTCNATNTAGAPNNLTFYWDYQNSPLLSGDRDGRVNITDSPEDASRQATSVLTIENITMSGEYKCLSSNKERDDASFATTNVTVICKCKNI